MLVEMDPFQNKMTIYELFDWKQLETIGKERKAMVIFIKSS